MAAPVSSSSSTISNFFDAIKSGFQKVGSVVSTAASDVANSGTVQKIKNAVVSFFKEAVSFLKTGTGAAIALVVASVTALTIAETSLQDHPWARRGITVVSAAAIFAAGVLFSTYGANPIKFSAAAL